MPCIYCSYLGASLLQCPLMYEPSNHVSLNIIVPSFGNMMTPWLKRESRQPISHNWNMDHFSSDSQKSKSKDHKDIQKIHIVLILHIEKILQFGKCWCTKNLQTFVFEGLNKKCHDLAFIIELENNGRVLKLSKLATGSSSSYLYFLI